MNHSSIIFKSIKLDAFLSYDEVEVQLDNLGIVYVKGINNQDSKTESNGSGKSALVAESIVWALTGRTTRGTDEVSNLYLDRGASVELELEKDGVNYVIHRGTHRSSIGNTVLIKRNGIELNTSGKITDGRAILQDEISDQLDWDKLTSIIVLAQGMNYTLSEYSSKDRRYKLEQLGNVSDTFERVKSKVDFELNKLNTRKSSISNQKSALEGAVSQAQMTIDSNEATIRTIKAQESNQEDLDSIESRISISKSELANLESQVPGITNEISALNTSVNSFNDKVDELGRLKSDVESKIRAIDSDLATSRRELTKLDSDKASNERRLESLKIARCPECGHPLNEQEVIQKTNDTNTVLTTIENEVTSVYDAISRLETNKKSLEPELESATINLNKVRDEQRRYQSKSSEFTRELMDLNSKISVAKSSITQLESLLDRSKTSNFDTSAYENMIAQSRQVIAEKSVLISELDRELTSLEEDIRLANWVNSKAARDIRAFLLTGVVSYLNTRLSEYSEMLFDSMRVRMSVDKSDINIYLDNRLIESVSGGERRRSDIVIQLALRDLAMVDSGLYSNLLVVDEALDYLDNTGVAHVLDLITTQKANVASIMLITHKTDADIYYDRLWTVEKSMDGISRLVE